MESSKNLLKSTSEKQEPLDENIFFGIYTSLYKHLESQRPFCAEGQEVILNAPFFINEENLEPLYVPKPNIVEESLKREIQKICYPESLINRVVYDSITPSFYHKQIDQKDYNLDILPFYIPKSIDDDTLIFESRFETGNLRRAIHIHEYEYDLILNPDESPKGHTQWYYFCVSNTRKNKQYTFNVLNLQKPDSLYNCGLQILIYSDKMSNKDNIGWHRDGYNVCYYQSNLKKKTSGYYYTLTWSIKFQYDFDCVFFAHCYPYTYTRLMSFLKTLECDAERKHVIKRATLVHTLANNPCEFLTITDFTIEEDIMS